MTNRLCLVLAVAAGAHTALGDNHFTSGTEGWLLVDFPTNGHVANPSTASVPFDSAFGNPAGSLRPGEGFYDTAVAAPSEYLGNHAASYGGLLKYDIYLRYTDGVMYPSVVINAGTFSLYYVTPSPALNTWETRSVPLTEAAWHYNSSSGPTATKDQMQAALAHITGIYILTEWHTGADDTNIDNVSMTGVGGCPADFNHDGFVNGDDYDAFASLFENGDIGADFNHDGFVNGDDYDSFASAFENGC
ncbi:MAG: laminin B domain-containing protein [Phycisphaerales bacterium]